MKLHFIILISLALTVSCGGGRTAKKETDTAENRTEIPTEKQQDARPKIKQYGYKVVKVFPHDTGSYTQGLFWHDGYLYEGTGQYGESRLMKSDLQSGKALQEIKLPAGYFGEGITWHNGKIYQITWMEGRALVYDGQTLEQEKVFTYRGEGWGITSDGKKLYMSDGTEKIYVRDPETFAIEKIITVTIGRNRQRNINELEWIDGEIWANVYLNRENRVVRIDPQTGYVTGIINFDGIQDEKDRLTDPDHVFNGIAYDRQTGNIYVTGKCWNKIYQVEIIEK